MCPAPFAVLGTEKSYRIESSGGEKPRILASGWGKNPDYRCLGQERLGKSPEEGKASFQADAG